MNETKRTEMKIFSMKIRAELLQMLKWRRYGHLGGAMSMVELLSALYKDQMKHSSSDPMSEDRDYLVLSKGHSAAALYCTLMLEGYFERDMLYTMNEGGTSLPSHPDRLKTPGIDVTTGSLGQGTSIAAGIALALRMQGRQNQYVYLIVGDGELNEGQCWEAFQFIAHYNLNNLIVIIDENKKQLDGYTKDIMNPQDIAEKLRAFGFETRRVAGRDEAAISAAIEECKRRKERVSCIVLDTVKGQGVRFFEELASNHSVKFDDAVDAEVDRCVAELKECINHLEGGQ